MLRQYNEYLKEQMVKEAEDEAQYDEIRQKAEGRIWDQRDAQLKAQRDARDTLMQQVSSSQLLSASACPAADSGNAPWAGFATHDMLHTARS